MSIRSILAFLIATISVPCAAQLAPPFPYPEPASESALRHTHGSVETGWYASSNAYRYMADLNVSFDVGSWHDAHLNFGGGILTLVKSGKTDNFQPDRYRGTVEPAIYLPRGRETYIFSIRHQSFHTIDRPKDAKESYELYNLAYQRPGTPNIRFSAGKFEHRNGVNYGWDFLGQVDDVCLGTCGKGRYYGSVTGHCVTESSNPTGRSGFFDFSLEAGVQTKTGIRYFAAYRRIHDIDKVNGITDNGILAGIKYLW